MAYDDKQLNNSVFDDLKSKFDNLDQKQKMVVLIVAGLFLFVMLSRIFGSSSNTAPVQTVTVREVSIDDSKPSKDEDEDISSEDSVFSADGADDAVLRRSFVNQALGEIETARDDMASDLSKIRAEAKTQKEEFTSLKNELQQTIRFFNEERSSYQQTIARQQEESVRLIEDLKEQQMREKESVGSISQQQDFLSQQPIKEKRRKITQEPLSMNNSNVRGTPLIAGLTSGIVGGDDGVERDVSKAAKDAAEDRSPFIPPLGFVKGTMLNGVDALTAGTTTPALVRLEGVYKTAMNSTITLNGCFMLVEFQGDISTERAKGKPARMTCVYPDQGAVTYSVSGYVVDSEDGVEGVPGLFFEGHAGRLALAIAAEFATGIADIIAANQTTSSVTSEGTKISTITGSQSKVSIYGSAADSLDTLEQYLADRASRVVPFIRLDALREVNIVLLSGTKLRKEGDAWSQLFKAD